MKDKVKSQNGMPKGLSYEAKKLWQDTVKMWELDDPTALVNLRNACFSLMRLRQAEAIVKREGMISTNSFSGTGEAPGNVDREGRDAVHAGIAGGLALGS